ncbi:MAG: hypothetical protein A2991_02190 [Candidatus Terrybacteria bacterium RIFCSPLOWO2_01_FULL_58_14]|uniref:nicotinamidase n=1 Tax=Candidatus Terrybacteria bacterium RIFCSPLOWO2_01_FULL_58_14 TaxID=1802369 RepID=A0A1G2PZE5_9BACT|nr:MAG: hypothetical protein A2991_02190 [Candidatus Terrybacteria bacterium RIFCSPLOWO2_01_FULL_58_14]
MPKTNDFVVDPEHDALVVVDVQKDFCEGGALPVPDAASIIPKIVDLMDQFPHVCTTRDWHEAPGDHFGDPPDFVDSWPIHCVAGTEGAEYHPALITDAFIDFVGMEFRKGKNRAAYSGFEGVNYSGRDLGDYLRLMKITRVFIVGLATDYCVKATALDAVRQGFRTIVLLKACRGVTPETAAAAIVEMRDSGVVCIE